MPRRGQVNTLGAFAGGFGLWPRPWCRQPVPPRSGAGIGCRCCKSPCSGDEDRCEQPRVADVDEVERLLRRLAVNDEESVDRVLVSGAEPLPPPMLSEKVELLVRLAALLALGAATASLRTMVERAIAAGATESEIVEVLVAVGPAVGLARVVSAAPRLALALGYEIEADE